MNIAIIPARGGSKRIPRKNIKYFFGKPIIAWSIEAAIASRLFETILVSTDDKEIAEIALSYGASVPFLRPKELADDYTGTTEVVAHAIQWLLNEGHSISAVCCLLATAPFVRSEDIVRGLFTLNSSSADFVITVTDFPAPIQRSFYELSSGGLQMFFPEHFSSRSQDLPESLHDAAQFYWGNKDAWINGMNIFCQNTVPIKIPRWRVQDIDNEDDWIRAEMLASKIFGNKF
jgi:pseudaminic acid cytidylyltransferase